MSDSAPAFRRSQLVLVLIGTIAALVLRAWLQTHYVQNGMHAELAKHLSFLWTLPALVLFLAPVLYQQRALVISILRWQTGTWGLIFRGILVGLLCRTLWWALVTLRAALGLAQSTGQFPELLWTFACPPAALLIIGFVTMAMVTPVVEELVHRGLIQTYFSRHGVLIGVFASAFIFMLFHSPMINPAVFCMGIVLAVQFHLTQSLWMSIATHGTYNGLIILDWHCVKLQWDPQPERLPLLGASIISAGVAVVALYAITRLLKRQKRRR